MQAVFLPLPRRAVCQFWGGSLTGNSISLIFYAGLLLYTSAQPQHNQIGAQEHH
jgi:hypothetical protein